MKIKSSNKLKKFRKPPGRKFLLALLIILGGCKSADLGTEPLKTSEPPRRFATQMAQAVHTDRNRTEAFGKKYAIATQGDFSTRAAQKMFQWGGNIVDAAVAASFTLAVERPQSTGISGGGFFLFHEAKSGKTYAVDFRERGPHRAKKNMFLDSHGQIQTKLSNDGVLAAAVPGFVAGLTEIHKKFGSLPFSKVMIPSIELAERGFPVYETLHEALVDRAPTLRRNPAARAIFLDSQGEAWPVGHILIQKDLANSLRLIQKKGREGFYQGFIAKSLIALSKKENGIIDQQDLDSYKVHWRPPLKGQFHDFEVLTMPPPSSGGVLVMHFLNILEQDKMATQGFLSAESIHLAASALQESFADRAYFLGDPDFSHIPTQGLISKNYAKLRRQEINPTKARKADQVGHGNPIPYESSETTHLSIMDNEGNAIATTQTINGWMGAGVVIPGTGIVLNNEMDDFSAKVGSSNMFGAIGGQANSVEPGKTPLSSMSPTILMREGRPVLSVGAPGGTRIISCVAQTILNYLEFRLPLYDSIASIRYHHQWQPDVLQIEAPGPKPAELQKLKNMGYEVKIAPIGCNVMAVSKEADQLHAVADPRDIGTSTSK